MADLKLKLKDVVKKTFDLALNEVHKITLIRPKVFVLDVEDGHFNFDRRVLLPDLASVDGSEPELDTRRVTGLGVIFAALVHAKKNAAQGLMVTGHTDASGNAGYNQPLSEDRATNVSLLLRGKRDDWRKLSAKGDHVDDVQAVLTWQADRAGWDCDPEGIDDKLGEKTRKAISGFQERYNAEVDKAKAAGLDSPFKAKIGVDGKVGEETWGAFYDVYMTELMDLLDLDAFSALQQMQAALKAPPGMKDSVGCGEHIPFNPARRDPFEEGKDEHLEGPQKNPPDRRVEILFFDPGEEVDLVCHPKPGQCKPDECQLYRKVLPHQQIPIGIPKGLTIAEVNLRLTFVDPEGKVRPLPEGLPVQAKFGDPKDSPSAALPSEDPLLDPDADADADAEGDDAEAAPGGEIPPESMAVPQEPTALVGPDGALQFTIARKSSTLFLRLLAGPEKRFVTADPKNLADSTLATESEAREAVGKGRVFFQLPPELNTGEGYFALPDAGVTFKDGAFQNFNDKETQIGNRGAPVELRLDVHWQHLKFEYFDRWTSSLTSVPQSRSKPADGSPAPALVLEGLATLVEAGDPTLTVEARSAWDVVQGKDTVHCLGWVRREVTADQPARVLPDDKCTTRFVTDRFFVRTSGDGKSPDAPRALVAFASGDDTPSKPSVDRLRLYDLPREWRSRIYPARLDGETPDKSRPFEQLAAKPSALGKPYVVSLDVIVLMGEGGPGPDLAFKLDDSKIENRFAILDNQLRVHKPDPASGEPYFTRVADLKPKPTGPVFVDVPPFTRLIAKGRFLYDVFDRRTGPFPAFKGVPVGARVALRLLDERMTPDGSTQTNVLPMTPTAAAFEPPRPNSTNSGPGKIGDTRTAVLRCCGHDKNVELFNVIQYMSVGFDFARTITADLIDEFGLLKSAKPLPAPPPNATGVARDCLLNVMARWNGGDTRNPSPTTFEIASPVAARGRYVLFLTRGALGTPPAKKSTMLPALARINLIQEGRAFMGGIRAEGFWRLSELKPDAEGSFTAAHEVGHILGEPDEYFNRDFQPSYDRTHIGEDARSAGNVYGEDDEAMMVGNFDVRARYFWDVLLFARERGHFTDAKTMAVKRGSVSFSTDVTPLDQSRVRFPVIQRTNVDVGARGRCDLIAYVTGRDEFSASPTLDPSAAATPYDGFVVVRVKMAWTVTTTTDYAEINTLIERSARTIRRVFNKESPLAIRAKFLGKSVRLRVLFAPRYVVRTFPEAGGERRTKYLKRVLLSEPFKKSDYEDKVKALIDARGIHVNVRVGSGEPGVSGTPLPREALVREDGRFLFFSNSRFDDDVIGTFAQMVGAPFERKGTVADYAALLTSLSSGLTDIVPEIVS